ncbi:hypothetical protein ACTFIR_000088 [Dictyostelium discoideum]
MNHLKIFFLVCLTILVSKVDSKNLNGEINSNTPFTKYVGKFCFGDDGGYVKANINWNDNNIDTARLLLFSDSIDNVVEKVESLSCNNTVTQSYEFNRYSNPSDLYQVEGQGEWYLVIQNCEKYPSNLKYDIDLIKEGDSYYKFLSADYRNVPVALKIFIFFGMVLVSFPFIYIKVLSKLELNGGVFKCLVLVMKLSLLSIILYFINLLFMIHNLHHIKLFLKLEIVRVYVLSKNLFFLLLIYTGHGWTTLLYSNSKVRNCINLLLVVFNISLGWSLSYINDYSKPDIKPYNYYLDCLPGYFSYAANGLLTVFFICNIVSYRSLNDAEQIAKTILKKFTFVFPIYLLSPILVGIIVHFVGDQMKFKISTILNYTFDFIFYIILMQNQKSLN